MSRRCDAYVGFRVIERSDQGAIPAVLSPRRSRSSSWMAAKRSAALFVVAFGLYPIFLVDFVSEFQWKQSGRRLFRA